LHNYPIMCTSITHFHTYSHAYGSLPCNYTSIDLLWTLSSITSDGQNTQSNEAWQAGSAEFQLARQSKRLKIQCEIWDNLPTNTEFWVGSNGVLWVSMSKTCTITHNYKWNAEYSNCLTQRKNGMPKDKRQELRYNKRQQLTNPKWTDAQSC
jgi:hypothetical protein